MLSVVMVNVIMLNVASNPFIPSVVQLGQKQMLIAVSVHYKSVMFLKYRPQGLEY
jgi:hypothetical protein